MQHLNDITPKEIVPGFFGKMIHGDSSTLSVWSVKQGSIMPEHHHVHEQITYLLAGELDMTIGGVRYHLTPGSTHVIPSNVPHSAVALTDCTIIDTFSPARDEYR